jgi:hypothetical protein
MVDRIKPGKTQEVQDKSPSGTIRPLYGGFIRDHLVGFRADLQTTLDMVKDGMDGLSGTDKKKAMQAEKDLEKAIKDLKGSSAKPAKASAKSTYDQPAPLEPSGSHMLYGVFIHNELDRYAVSIMSVVQEIESGLGTLSGDELKEAKAALKDLKQAVKDLG